MSKLPKFAVVCCALIVGFSSVATADELLISFVGELTEFDGPEEISPFNAAGQLGAAVVTNPDLIKADGQFIVKDFDPNVAGTQTFSFAPGVGADPGVEFFLHSPLLERIEAYTTRIGSNSPQGYSENTKILLPRKEDTTTTDESEVTTTGFFGSGTLTVVDGVPVSLAYVAGPDAMSSFDFVFSPSSIEELTISGDDFVLTNTYNLDFAGAADNAPYGLNSDLSGNAGSTVLDTTRGIIQAELDAPFASGGTGNLLTNKESKGGVPLPFNPLNGTGTLYHYSLTDAEMGAVAVVPEPSSAILALLGGLAILAVRRRR